MKKMFSILAVTTIACLGAEGVNAASWVGSSKSAQIQALSFIQGVAQARSAGNGVLSADLGANTVSASSGPEDVGYLHGKPRSFGAIRVDTAVSPPDSESSAVLMTFTNGCVDRDVAREKFQFKEVVATPGPEDPNPVVGYGFFLGESAISLYFDATGSNCLLSARVEDASLLRDAFLKRDRLQQELLESKTHK